MSVPTEVGTSASGSAWVSDLSLCDGALEFAAALSSGSWLRIWSSQANVHDIAVHNHWLIVLRFPLVRDVGEVSRCVLHELHQSGSGSSDVTVSIPSASSLVAGPSPVCDCTYVSSFACAPIPIRFVQASVLHSGSKRQVHTILGLHPSVCV